MRRRDDLGQDFQENLAICVLDSFLIGQVRLEVFRDARLGKLKGDGVVSNVKGMFGEFGGGQCCGSNVCVLVNLYIEVLMFRVIVFGDGVYRK